MSATSYSLPSVLSSRPGLVPELDPGFRPAVLANRNYAAKVDACPTSEPVLMAIEQADGSTFRFDTRILPATHPDAPATDTFLERRTKFLLWSRGGCRIYVAGPAGVADRLRRHYETAPTGRFDAEIMGNRIYEEPFEIVACSPGDMPAPRETTRPLGRHLKGCRIGFDLGASDRKVAAVIDGEVVFSEETVWNPVVQNDPQWHFDQIMDSLRRGAEHLPRVDAIGGSAAGVYVNNRVKVASLFRGVPAPLFNSRVKDLFLEMKTAWKNIPFEVVNDGEVTALAGSMAIGCNSLLGIAMGSSEAAGYVTPDGTITSWLNELAFAPIDYNPDAAVDEWSGDHGCGALYFSQQGVGRLVGPAGIDLPADMPLPKRLEHVQALMAQGDPRAARIYRSIGTCFGYAMAHYADFYRIENVLVLGRVTTGDGGALILESARSVLDREFATLSPSIVFHIPDEKQKRHGQAIAAASLAVAT